MIAHWCATTHATFRRFFDAPVNATVATHISQTSLKQYTTKGAPEILIKYCVDGWIQC